jgi:acetylornithine/N-succinyldiaminopimelate aminotransferase
MPEPTAPAISLTPHLMNTYRRPPVVFVAGEGCWLRDSSGQRYLDFLSGIGVNALGHAHPRLHAVIAGQAARLIHVSNLYHHPYQEPLAARLAELSGLDRVFFTNSGAEAIETALKLARLWARRNGRNATRWLAVEGSFHGRTFGALSVTWPAAYREPFEPLVPGVDFVAFNDVADLEQKFDDGVCAVVVEPVQGEGGIRPVSREFWQRARALTAQSGALLIADEIQCGLGRTGNWFAWQRLGEAPDVMTLAKPLAGGLPLGAVLARNEVAEVLTPGLHGSTFGGGPLACAVALEVLRVIEDENLLENIRARGAQLRAGLEAIATRCGLVREVRGEGLMLGIELRAPGGAVVERALEAGLLINCTHERVLRLLPPYIVTAAEVDACLERLAGVLARAEAEYAAAAGSGAGGG